MLGEGEGGGGGGDLGEEWEGEGEDEFCVPNPLLKNKENGRKEKENGQSYQRVIIIAPGTVCVCITWYRCA